MIARSTASPHINPNRLEYSKTVLAYGGDINGSYGRPAAMNFLAGLRLTIAKVMGQITSSTEQGHGSYKCGTVVTCTTIQQQGMDMVPKDHNKPSDKNRKGTSTAGKTDKSRTKFSTCDE